MFDDLIEWGNSSAAGNEGQLGKFFFVSLLPKKLEKARIFIQDEKTISVIKVASDWPVNSHKIILLELIEEVAHFPSLKLALWPIKLYQDVAEAFLCSYADWGIRSFDFSSFCIKCASR